MANLRCMVVLQNRSGLSEDRIVNTFHFTAASSDLADVEPIATKLTSLYNDPLPDKTDYSIARCLSAVVDRGTNKSQFRFYDLADPEPREPTVVEWTLGSAGGDVRGMPNEVGLTLSYFSVRNVPRRRGRIYLGPLSESLSGTETADVRPPTAIVGGIVRQFGTMIQTGGPHPWIWGLWSMADGAAEHTPATEMKAVTNCWMDNAFDTVRSRGAKATLRTVYPVE